MSVNEIRKLKRGLRDISSLFNAESADVKSSGIKQAGFQIEILNVFSPDFPADSFFLNTFLASQITTQERPCSILSIQPSSQPVSEQIQIHQPGSHFVPMESHGENLKRFLLSWERFEEICCHAPCHEGGVSLSQTLFLDLDALLLPQMEKVIPLLDKWILLLRPSLDSLTEAYKWMKGGAFLNRELDYFILFEGHPNDERGEKLFEKLSAITEKNLGIHLFWLGYLNLASHSQYFVSELLIDHLFLNSIKKIEYPEKINLYHELLSH